MTGPSWESTVHANHPDHATRIEELHRTNR